MACEMGPTWVAQPQALAACGYPPAAGAASTPDEQRASTPDHFAGSSSGASSVGGRTEPHVAIVYASWNAFYVQPLLQASQEVLCSAGAVCKPICVPGANDIVAGTRAALRSSPDAVLCIGVLIRGESDSHARMCQGISQGLARLNAQQDVPIINGTVMCHDEDQAYERTHGEKSQAAEWAKSALFMAELSGNADLSSEALRGA